LKGFSRYYRDPLFKSEVDNQFALADASTHSGTWVTYAIHDPSREDHVGGHGEGLIVYVGQSKQFGTRVRDRMRSAGGAIRRPTDHIDGLLYDIMARGPAPRWSVLEEVASAIDSFVSETNWTTRMRAQGNPLVNQWIEQRWGTLEVDRYGVPHKRLWAITVSDAIGSGIEVAVSDPATDEQVMVDLETLPPNTRLQKVKAHASQTGRRARLIVR
jgi:hypothetical protein